LFDEDLEKREKEDGDDEIAFYPSVVIKGLI